MEVLIAGAHGKVARHLTRLLAAGGDTARGLIRNPAHLGIEALRDWVDRHAPRYILHGHVHPVGGRVMTRLGDTRVHWVSGAQVLNLS